MTMRNAMRKKGQPQGEKEIFDILISAKYINGKFNKTKPTQQNGLA